MGFLALSSSLSLQSPPEPIRSYHTIYFHQGRESTMSFHPTAILRWERAPCSTIFTECSAPKLCVKAQLNLSQHGFTTPPCMYRPSAWMANSLCPPSVGMMDVDEPAMDRSTCMGLTSEYRHRLNTHFILSSSDPCVASVGVKAGLGPQLQKWETKLSTSRNCGVQLDRLSPSHQFPLYTSLSDLHQCPVPQAGPHRSRPHRSGLGDRPNSAESF